MKTNSQRPITQESTIVPKKWARLPYHQTTEDYDMVNHFIDLIGAYPSVYHIAGRYIYEQALDVIGTCDKSMKEWDNTNDTYITSVHRIEHGGQVILVRMGRTYVSESHQYNITKDQEKYSKTAKGYVVTSGIDLLYDQSDGLSEDVINMFKAIKLDDDNVDHNSVHLICRNSDMTLYTKDYPLLRERQYDFDLDLHYGEGFKTFHDFNVQRIDESDKGIVLFHGSPGTGKSFYVRRLMRDLARRKKKILYLPNNMIDMLGTPEFNNFLLDWVDDQDEVRDGIIIIIEDAERVLIKREINKYGADGVANILNSTDGILNDFFSIQVIATFNTDMKNIDEAILRKQRMISIREFKTLTQAEAQKLADHLGLQNTINTSMTLADIYSLKQDHANKVLLGEITDRKKIGF